MASNVERCDLSPDLSISRVLTGLWQVADMERDGRQVDLDRAAAAMQRYAEAGLTTFDMADHYGSAEVIAGRFRSHAPQQAAQLFTKWVPKPGRVPAADVLAAVERARMRLGVAAIDLLQYHAWNYADPSWLDTLFDLQTLKAQGLVRHLGLTNIDTAHLRVAVASGIDVVSNQVSFSLLDQRAAGGLVPFCVEHGVQLLAYGTLAGGWLTDRWLGAPEPDWERLATWSLMKYGRFLRVAGGWSALQRVLKAAASVAARHGVSIANVASRYVLDQPGVAGVIIGARLGEREHIEDTLRIFSLVLTDRDRVEIRDAVATLRPIPGDCGDEYRRPPFLTASGDLSHHLDSMPAPYQTVARDGGRTLCLSGTTWERVAGFARAVRQGARVIVSGTTATIGNRVVGGSDPVAQTHFVIDKIEGALQSLGATLADVIGTRVYVRHIADWEPVAKAHGARFGAIQPANTLVVADLVGEAYLVEIEAEAQVRGEAE
ncbi:MAG TPA: aldo/keto reductase [Vicinamibacterales bacterium]|nr:aldo/keto reductase [Vicinamibacterales bacterium]